MDNKQEQTKSPLPSSDKAVYTADQKRMNFGEAMNAVLEGRKVRRLDWGKDDYGFLGGDDVLTIHLEKDKQTHHWLVNKGDLEGIDYVLI